MQDRRQNAKCARILWREKLRDECKKRASERRQEILRKCREPGDRLSAQSVALDMQQILHAEMATLGPPPDLLSPEELLAEEQDLMAFLRELEHQLYAEVAQQLEQEDQQALLDHIADMEAQEAYREEGRVLCPVCQSAYLTSYQGFIGCPRDRFQLDVRSESITLDYIRERLCSIYEAHGASGCSGALQFSVDAGVGPTSLVGRCPQCGIFEVAV